MKIETFDFEVKKSMMISVNKSIIEGSISEENISNCDKVFNKISVAEQELDIYLYNLWIDIKRYFREFYNKNKELLNEFLRFVNDQLYNITNIKEPNKVMVKVKGGKNE